MYFLDALKVVKRRWYIVLVGALLTAAAAGVAIKVVPTSYQASGQMVLLLPPEAVEEGKTVNPFINLQAGLTVAATLIASNVSTMDEHEEMKARGFPSEYAVGLNPGAGPLLQVTVTDTDPKTVNATRDEVMRRLNSELKLIQAADKLPERQVIHSREYSVSAQPEVLRGSKLRALAVIGGVGITLTLVVAFALDRFLLRRSTTRRRAGKQKDGGGDPPVSLRNAASDRPRSARHSRLGLEPANARLTTKDEAELPRPRAVNDGSRSPSRRNEISDGRHG